MHMLENHCLNFILFVINFVTGLFDSSLFITLAGVTNEDQICIVPFVYKPVCGSDGVTYSNDYGLRCEQKKNPGMFLFLKQFCYQ